MSVIKTSLLLVVFGYGAIRALRKVCLPLIFINLATASTAQDITIAALGDSLTQGYGLPPEDGLVPQLSDWLVARGVVGVRLINAGVSGDTTAGGLSRVDWTLTPEVDAMIVTLGGNDVLRGFDAAVSKANLTGILDAAQKADVEVLLIGMSAPSNYGPEYKAAFDSMYGALAVQYDTLFVPRFFDGITGEEVERELTPADVSSYMQSDGIHPNAEGVGNIVASIGPKVLELISLVAR